MSLSYPGSDFARGGLSKKALATLVSQLMQTPASTAAAAWRAVSAPYVLPAMLRVMSAMALSYWLVQLAKHHIS